jgi:cytochrome P450
MLNFFPSITASDGVRARAHLQDRFAKYYSAKNDLNADVGVVTKARASLLRRNDVPDDEIGRIEISLYHVASVNTIPTLYWFFVYIWPDRELVNRLREQVATITEQDENGLATLRLSELDEKCPLLVSCYRETMRLTNHQTSARKVMRDTTISDGKGHSYLLKKGVDVQIASGTMHREEEIWGNNAENFDPERFLEGAKHKNIDGHLAKLRKLSFVPFGGGKHLCPGRNFAFMENMALMAAMLIGFEIHSSAGETAPWKIPEQGAWGFSDAATKPVNNGEGLGVWISRRPGWEKATWTFQF